MNEACWGGVGMEGEDIVLVECWVNSTLGVSEPDKWSGYLSRCLLGFSCRCLHYRDQELYRSCPAEQVSSNNNTKFQRCWFDAYIAQSTKFKTLRLSS